MESYQQIKARQQAEVNAFPFGCAFGNKQLAEMMQKFGLPNDESGYAQLVSIGSGCYIRREHVPAWNELAERHEREMREFCKDHEALKKALRYEFANHEAQFSCNDEVILGCFGLTVKEVNEDPELKKTYNEAWKLFWADCIKNDWF